MRALGSDSDDLWYLTRLCRRQRANLERYGNEGNIFMMMVISMATRGAYPNQQKRKKSDGWIEGIETDVVLKLPVSEGKH
jgi:hypothetical protein